MRLQRPAASPHLTSSLHLPTVSDKPARLHNARMSRRTQRISTDELDDQSSVAAAFAYDHWPPHAFNLIIDANFQGLIRSIFVARDPDKAALQRAMAFDAAGTKTA